MRKKENILRVAKGLGGIIASMVAEKIIEEIWRSLEKKYSL